MTQEQAREMCKAFEATGKFSEVRVAVVGGEFAEPNAPWEIELWSVNARVGNRNLTMIRDFDLAAVPALTRQAVGKSSARDRQAFARQAQEREQG